LNELFDVDEEEDENEHDEEDDGSQHFEEATDDESWKPQSDEWKYEEGEWTENEDDNFELTDFNPSLPASGPLVDSVNEEQLGNPALTGFIPFLHWLVSWTILRLFCWMKANCVGKLKI
jgi:hypothetical protein